MTRKRWYHCSLLIPLVVPLLVMLAAKLTGTFLKSNSLLGWFSLAALLQLVLGGFQYVLFVFFVMGWGREKTMKQIERASWVMPLWFWPWCTLWLLLLTTFMGRVHFFIMIGLFAIPYGYFYVLLAHTLTWLLKKSRLIVD